MAAADAVLWPLAWLAVVRALPEPVGLVGPVLLAVLAFCAVGRLHRAVCTNHRYWFTTWRWGKVLAAMAFIGLVLKLSLGGWTA